jgi:hypothetical protein
MLSACLVLVIELLKWKKFDNKNVVTARNEVSNVLDMQHFHRGHLCRKHIRRRHVNRN